MMYRLFFTVLFAVLCISCHTKQEDCKKYFAGKWGYKQHPSSKIYAVRTLTKQIEYVENGKYHFDFDIRWINNCEYEITYLGTNSPKPAVAKVGEKTTVQILKIDEEKMSYHTKFGQMEETGDMVRIGD